jgi:hypothetical protein
MLEITFTELALFVWGVGATCLWVDAKNDRDMARFVMRKFVEDEEVRNKVLKDWEASKGKQNAI